MPIEGFKAYPVSRAVNNPIHDSPDCVQRLPSASRVLALRGREGIGVSPPF